MEETFAARRAPPIAEGVVYGTLAAKPAPAASLSMQTRLIMHRRKERADKNRLAEGANEFRFQGERSMETPHFELFE